MAENQANAQGTEQPVCSACGSPIVPEDVSEGRARQVGGRIFCASCMEAQAKAEAVKCRECGSEEPPLYDGRKYLCRKCGAAVKLATRPPVKAPVAVCPYCKEPVASGARLCPACGARLIGSLKPSAPLALRDYLIGAAVAAAIFAVAALVTSGRGVSPQQPAASADQTGGLESKLDVFERKITQTVEINVSTFKEEMKSTVGEAIAAETDLLRRRLDQLEGQLAAEPAVVGKPDEEGEASDLAALLAKIGETEGRVAEREAEAVVVPPVDRVEEPAAGRPKPSIVLVDEENVYLDGERVALDQLAPLLEKKRPGDVRPEDQVVILKAKTTVRYERIIQAVNQITRAGVVALVMRKVDEGAEEETVRAEETPAPEVDEHKRAISRLKADVKGLADEKQFAAALALLESRPDIRDPVWQADREKAKQEIRRHVEELFQVDLARAERMVRNRQYDDARGIYQEVRKYGLPHMAQEANKRLAELEPEPPEEVVTAALPDERTEPVTVSEDEDPRVAQFIAQLSDKQAAQHVRTRAAKELGVLRARSAVDPLVNALDDRDWYLRVCAARSLMQIGDARAVPALINNLGHPMIPARETAREALTKITGQDFGRDTEAWEKWWKAEGTREIPAGERGTLEESGPAEVIEVAREPQSLSSQVVIFNEAESTLTFNIPANSGLKVGQKITMTREGEELATAEITVVGFGIATGKILELAQGATIKSGDLVTVER